MEFAKHKMMKSWRQLRTFIFEFLRKMWQKSFYDIVHMCTDVSKIIKRDLTSSQQMCNTQTGVNVSFMPVPSLFLSIRMFHLLSLFSCCVWFLTNAHIEIHMCCRCWCCSLQAWMSKRVRGYLFQNFRCWEEGEYKIERKYKIYSQSLSKCILRSPRHFLKREARDRISSIVIVWIFAFKCCVYMCLLMCACIVMCEIKWVIWSPFFSIWGSFMGDA